MRLPLTSPVGLLLLLAASASMVSCSRKLKSGTAELERDPEGESPMAQVEQGWLGHLGSARDGRSREPLGKADWSSEPARLWAAQVGTGVSGIVVHDGRLYTSGNSNASDVVACIDAVSGQELWSVSYPCPLDDRQFQGGPAATPTLAPAAGSLFVLSHQGELRCLDAADGSVRWKTHLVDDLGGKRPKWGYAGAPLLAGGLLVVEPGGNGCSAAALDPATGDVRWKAGSDAAAYAAPVAYPREGGWGVAFFNAAGLVGRDPADGSELFRQKWETSYDVNAATPVYHGGHFFVCSGYGKGGGLISITGGAAELVYETRDAVAQFQSAVRVEDHLFLITGDNNSKSRLNCLRFDNGELQWTEAVGGNRGNVIVVDGHLIAVSERGEVIVCKADPGGYEELGRFQAVGQPVWAPPAFAGGMLFVRSNKGELAAWDLR